MRRGLVTHSCKVYTYTYTKLHIQCTQFVMENLNQYRICKGATNLAVNGHPQDDPGRVIIH